MASSRTTDQTSDDLRAGARVGRFNRLKDFVPYGQARRAGAAIPADRVVYFSAEDLRQLRVDLTGTRVVMARGPCLPPREELDDYLSIPPLAPILLANLLQSYGASVQIRDLCLLRRTQPESLSALWDTDLSAADWDAWFAGGAGSEPEELVEQLLVELEVRDVDVLAFSAETRGDFRLGLALGQALGTRYGIRTVIGGRGVSLPEPLMERCAEAIVIHGEGEVPLLLALDALVHGRDWGEVPSLARYADGRMQMTHRLIHDLDIRPTYDVAGAPLLGYVGAIEVEGAGPTVPYQYSLGCPFFCGYCNATSRRAYRLRAPDRIVADLQNVVHRSGVRRFHMLSHLFNSDRRHVAELLDRLEAARLDIYWSDSCRPAGLDADLLGRMRRVGASTLTWGVDCGSARLARLMRKGLNHEQAIAIFRASARAGIRNVVNIIFGMPHETEADIEEALRFMDRARPYVHKFNAPRYVYNAESLLGRDPERFGLVAGRPFQEPAEMTDARLRQVRRAVPSWTGYDLRGQLERVLTGPAMRTLRRYLPR